MCCFLGMSTGVSCRNLGLRSFSGVMLGMWGECHLEAGSPWSPSGTEASRKQWVRASWAHLCLTREVTSYMTLDVGRHPFSMTFLICKMEGNLFNVKWDCGAASTIMETSTTHWVHGQEWLFLWSDNRRRPSSWLSSFLMGVSFKGIHHWAWFPTVMQEDICFPANLHLSNGRQTNAVADHLSFTCVFNRKSLSWHVLHCVCLVESVFIKSVVITCHLKLIQPLAASLHFNQYLNHWYLVITLV